MLSAVTHDSEARGADIDDSILPAGSCGVVAEAGMQTQALHEALERLGVIVRLTPPTLVSDKLWRTPGPRVVLTRGPKAVAALAGWMPIIHAAPHTATLALLDTGRAEVLAALSVYDIWLPQTTSAAVVAQQVLALLALLDRQARLTSPRLIHGVNLVIDLGRDEAYDGQGVQLPLTPSEFRLLAALAVQPGRTLDFGQLGMVLPGKFRDAEDAYNSVKVHIGRLRAKLAHGTGWDGHLVSVRGRGFLFERRQPLSDEAEPASMEPSYAPARLRPLDPTG